MHTSTQAAEIHAAVKKTLTSAAFSKFMSQAVHAAFEQAATTPKGIELCAMAKPLRFRENQYAVLDYYSCDYQSNVTIYRGHKDASPHIYWGSERRKDASGQEWSRSLPHCVMDDFANLVAVAA